MPSFKSLIIGSTYIATVLFATVTLSQPLVTQETLFV